MRIFRKTIFWLHLVSGLVAGMVIAIMSATGIGIAFEEEILEWYDRKVSHIGSAPAGAERLPVEELLRRIGVERPAFDVSSVTVPRDPEHAWRFSEGRKGQLYVNPFTGGVEDSRADAAHDFIHTLEEWHRWLGAEDEAILGGRLVTGICNLAFVFLCVTGLYLWFPRNWSRRALRPLLWLKSGYKGKARDFNWHNVLVVS